MNLEKEKDLAYYEALPYTVVVRKDEDGDFVARINELPGCISHGSTEASAIESVHSMQRLWIEDALSEGDVIPEPENPAEMPSGKWVQRVPRKLHKDLASLAERENVSLNQLVTSMLSEAVAVRSCVEAVQNAMANVYTGYGSAEGINAWWGWDKSPRDTQWIASPLKGNLMQAIAHFRMLEKPHEVRFGDKETYFLHEHATTK